jgi:hypothetical protein
MNKTILINTLMLLCFAGICFCQTLPIYNTCSFEHSSEDSDDIGYMCSLGCAIGWDVIASSCLASQSGNSYDANKIDDGKLSTAWIEGKKGVGIGETITFHFPKHYFSEGGIGDSINFNGFRILNGYQKDSLTWKANGRVKRLRVYHNQVPVCDILVEDTMLMQEADPKILFYIKPEDIIIVKIMEVYRGAKYEDTAISELVPEGAH